jgi:PAS domain S-box-containing protein
MNPKLQARFETLKSSGLLPSPKGPALAVVQLTRQDNVSSAQLARAIQPDPALVAHLLKLANACKAPGARSILALKDAIGILGLTAVRGLALGFSLMSDKRGSRCRTFNYPKFWSKNLARAVAMQALAASSHLIQSDEAFTLGLLSHIGELGLASLFPEDYARLLEPTALSNSSTERLARELQSFEFDHADLTAALLDDWGFPESLIGPVSFHEQPEAAHFVAGSRAERLLLTLMLASKIANICLAAKDQRRAMIARLLLLGGKLSIGADDLMALCDGIVRDWSDWCRLLEVPSQPMPPFVELMNAPPAPSLEQGDGLTKVSTAEGFRVLVVDDDRSIRLLLMSLLTKAGYLCSEAENGRQGLELARTELPDLMIVDWMMPEMDGIELIRRLRETESGRAIYILLLTGLDQEARLVEAFAAGADDFLSKPLNANVLTARLLAGQRVVTLHREMDRDHTNLQRFATEFARLNQRLQEGYKKDTANQTRMELATRAGGVGIWDWDLAPNILTWDDQMLALYGVTREQFGGAYAAWKAGVLPEDATQADKEIQMALHGTKEFDTEFRVRWPNGTIRNIRALGSVERDAAGKALRMIGTNWDITALKQIEAELLRSNNELEQFSYSISHDMRQPLRMISSYLQLLQNGLGETLDAEKREYFNFAIDGAKRMDAMMLGLLDYSRVGRLDEPPAWIESRTALDEALLFLRPAIAEAQAAVRIAGDWPKILASPDEMLRLLQNLIGNALKFRVEGRPPEIVVTSETIDNAWRLCVTDNGVGILPDQIGRLFQVFQRLQSRTDYEGTGIGLALCRKIAERHGGRIWAESAGDGMGSRFCVELPLRQESETP